MNVRFTHSSEDLFHTDLKKRVDHYFTSNKIPKTGNATMYIKTVVIMTVHFLCYGLILTAPISIGTQLLLCIVMGFAVAGIGMSVMHDACHGSFTPNRKLNELLSYTLNIVGGNAYNWKIQHNVKHHTFTNIYGADEDVNNGNVVRLSPYSPYRSYYKFQHIYAWFLYMLGTFSWVLLKDFKQLFQLRNENIQDYSFGKEMTKLIISKAIYWTYMIVIPMMVLDLPFYAILIGFLVMHFVAGFTLSVVFQLAHIVEDLEHDDKFKLSKVDHSWARHQVLTTCNFARKSAFLNWYLGGLNFQVEHHLFPNICHVHYSKISNIVKATVEDHGMVYHEFPTFLDAIQSHYRTLKKFGATEVYPQKTMIA